jgi:hypothetical protein
MTKIYVIKIPSHIKLHSIVAWDDSKGDYRHVAANIQEATLMKDLTKKVSKSLCRKVCVYGVEDLTK